VTGSSTVRIQFAATAGPADTGWWLRADCTPRRDRPQRSVRVSVCGSADRVRRRDTRLRCIGPPDIAPGCGSLLTPVGTVRTNWWCSTSVATSSVRGHEKVPTGGQVEVPTGGQIKVPTPCSSCRSGTAGPGGDGEGANHTPPPPGSSIEVCEGPYGHHFCLSTSRVVPGGR
jgi:hypothetical protein